MSWRPDLPHWWGPLLMKQKKQRLPEYWVRPSSEHVKPSPSGSHEFPSVKTTGPLGFTALITHTKWIIWRIIFVWLHFWIKTTNCLNENYPSLFLQCFGIRHENLSTFWDQLESWFPQMKNKGWIRTQVSKSQTTGQIHPGSLPIFVPSASWKWLLYFQVIEQNKKEPNMWALYETQFPVPLYTIFRGYTAFLSCLYYLVLLLHQNGQVTSTQPNLSITWPFGESLPASG